MIWISVMWKPILIFVYLVGTLAVGLPLAYASVWLWAWDESRWPWWSYLVFPTAKCVGRYGETKWSFLFIEELRVVPVRGRYTPSNFEVYVFVTMLIWPLRCTGNFCLLCLGLFRNKAVAKMRLVSMLK